MKNLSRIAAAGTDAQTPYISPVRQKKRRKILDEARRLIVEFSLYNVTMEQIAEAVGTTSRTLYNYYSSKEELAIDIFIEVVDQWDASLSMPPHDGANGYERLESIVRFFVEQGTRHPETLKFITAFDFYFYKGYPNDKIKTFFETAGHHDLARFVEDGIADGSIKDVGIPADEIVNTILHSLIAYIQKNIYRSESYRASSRERDRGSAETLVRLIMEGLRA